MTEIDKKIKVKQIYLNNNQIYTHLAKKFGVYPRLFGADLGGKQYKVFKNRIAYDYHYVELKNLDSEESFVAFCHAYAKCVQYKEMGLFKMILIKAVLIWPWYWFNKNPDPELYYLTNKFLEVMQELLDNFSFGFENVGDDVE